MSVLRKLLSDKVYPAGLIFLALSFAIFMLPGVFKSSDGDFGVFFLNYVFTVIYFIVLMVTRKSREDNTPHIFVFLLLALVSAYSLNRSVAVFQLSVPWVCVALVTYSMVYLLAGIWDGLSLRIRYLLSFLLGSSLLFFTYLALYCASLMPIGVIAAIALGFSLHIFVPLLFIIYTVKFSIRIIREDRRYGFTMAAGFTLSLLVAIVFAVQWNSMNETVNRSFRHSLIADNTDLPGWAKVARRLPDNWVTERYLKSGLVYSMSGNFFSDMEFVPKMNMNEVRKHDPLVVIATLFARPQMMAEEEKVKVIEAVYDARHNTQDRLWSGANLHTGSVISNVRIWPALRMAYTEKTITVSNNSVRSNTWDREEAIYTFHLPEGSVVTSLSLWINGKEEKGVLTSLKKADSAYRQIVGVEQHDPSVIHWQEGNVVSVRVFPVMPGQSRIFKIGITSPLRMAGSELVYETAYFEGPDATGTEETVQLAITGEPAGFKMPDGFKVNGDHRYIREAVYDPYFHLSMSRPALDTKSTFSFGGNSYGILPFTVQRQPMHLQQIYLDVNKAWSRDEFYDLCDKFSGYKLFAYIDDMVQITPENRSELFGQLAKQRFSLFPFFAVSDPATSLIISKSPEHSPGIKTLKGSDFMQKLSAHLAKGYEYRLYNIGPQLSPYLRTLREHRAFSYEEGDVDLLKKLVAERQFAHSTEDSDHVAVGNAGIVLARTKDTTKGSGPDHLMRLFAYNHILQQLKNDISGNYAKDSVLVSEAEEAYVVSPVSSLIVLESQADYDRFKIKKSANTLDDASLRSKGAVPEPHEWALIIIAVLMGAWLLYSDKLKKRFGHLWSR